MLGNCITILNVNHFINQKLKYRFSVVLLAFFCSSLFASENQSIQIIKPKPAAPAEKPAAIDSERFEVGVFLGTLSVEDFSSRSVKGFSVGYHLAERWLAEINVGQSDVGRATFEDVIGGDFLNDNEEKFRFFDGISSFRVFSGHSFYGKGNKYDSFIYLKTGVTHIEFAGNSKSGLLLGTQFKIVTTDWMTLNLNFSDRIFDRDFLNDKKTTHNIEFSIGIHALF